MSEDSETKSRLRKYYKGDGIGVGAAAGVALGAAFDHLAVGLALGVAFGAAADVVSYLRRKETNKPLD
jgi:hypothetical protein